IRAQHVRAAYSRGNVVVGANRRGEHDPPAPAWDRDGLSRGLSCHATRSSGRRRGGARAGPSTAPAGVLRSVRAIKIIAFKASHPTTSSRVSERMDTASETADAAAPTAKSWSWGGDVRGCERGCL